MSKNIHEIFSSWGKSQRQMPENIKKPELSGLTIKPAKSFPKLSLAFAGLAVLAIILIQPAKITTVSTTMESKGVAQDMAYPDYYPRPEPAGVPISDDRELMKIDYSAQIKTRDTTEATERVQLIVRGLRGRVDSMNSSEKYGQVTFALPESKLAQFRTELKLIAGGRFVIENISANNLLPEQRAIEEAIKNTKDPKEIEKLTKQKDQIAETIATVRGTITFQKITFLEMLNIYTGGYWITILLALAAIGSLVLPRRLPDVGV